MSSRLYRELKLRGAIVQNKQLKVLPLEQVKFDNQFESGTMNIDLCFYRFTHLCMVFGIFQVTLVI